MNFARNVSILFVVLLPVSACHARNATLPHGDSVAITTGAGAGKSQATDASFSCLIDGKLFASSGTDGLGNAAIKTAPDIINFVLVSMDPQYKNTVPPQLSFYISPSGSTSIKGSGGKYAVKYSPAATLDDDYIADQVTVNITSITASRIKGTFSGKFSSTKKSIQITEGKFDLPASKYSKALQ